MPESLRTVAVIGLLIGFLVVGSIGTFLGSAMLDAMAIQSCSTEIPGSKELAVTDTGQIWASTDTGQIWTVAQQLGVPGDETAYALANLGNGVILVGTSNNSLWPPVPPIAEIWRSTDYGATFSLDQQLVTEQVTHFAYLGNNVVLAGTINVTNSTMGIYRSLDTGVTWTPNNEFSCAWGCWGFKQWSPVTSLGGGVALASGDLDGLARVLRSIDYGTTWTNISVTGGGPWNSSYIQSFADLGSGIALAGMWSGGILGDQGIWRSDNYGQTWTQAQQMGIATSEFPAVISLGNNIAVTGTFSWANFSTEISRSLDSGQNWGLAQGLAPAQFYVYTITNIGDGTAIAGSGQVNGQIWRTTDYGATWTLAQTLGSSVAVYDTITTIILCTESPMYASQSGVVSTFALGVILCRILVIVSLAGLGTVILQRTGLIPRFGAGGGGGEAA